MPWEIARELGGEPEQISLALAGLHGAGLARLL